MTATIQSRPARIATVIVGILLVAAGCATSGGANISPAAPVPAGAARGGQGVASGARDLAGQPAQATAGPAQAPDAAKDDAKIVRTGTLQLQVKDLGVATSRARDAIRALGGYIGASHESNDDQPVAEITYRIPTDRWDDGLDALRALAVKVIGENSEAVEVTGQLVDLGARIRNLQASETALQAIAARATKISDVLEVEARLTDVRGQIEQLAAQQAQLTDQVSYGTLTVTYGLQIVAVTQATKRWDAAREVDQASANLVDILQAAATAGIWFAIVWLPLIFAGLIVAGIIVAVGRRMGLRLPRNPKPEFPIANPPTPPAVSGA